MLEELGGHSFLRKYEVRLCIYIERELSQGGWEEERLFVWPAWKVEGRRVRPENAS